MLKLSRADARRLLVHHHFRRGTAREVLERLGSVQFDPLNPVGCNHDLVLQARVPDYRVGDWQKLAYEERFLYDAWDKQASLVLMRDWPLRRIYHRWHRRHWPEVFEEHPEAIEVVRAELARRGPLTSSAFEYQAHKDEWRGSWYGARLTKRVLRALWHTGEVVTYSRKNGHHVYDLAERVIPEELYRTAPVSDAESVAWLLKLRHRAVGLLRPNASQEVWSLSISAAERKALLADLVREGRLVPVEVDGVCFHALPETLRLIDEAPLPPAVRFLAPLDQLMWDRRAVQHLFDFEYVWEVYKPLKDRKWGYYVLPVMYGDSFVARFDGKLEHGTWHLKGWWWEAGVTPDATLLAGLERAAVNFMRYLGARKVKIAGSVDKRVRVALKAAGEVM